MTYIEFNGTAHTVEVPVGTSLIRGAIDNLISDINMPGMDGLTLLREVKQLRPDLPVMMVTAYGDDERRRQASKYGAAEFITKPVDFDFLKCQLRQLPTGTA